MIHELLPSRLKDTVKGNPKNIGRLLEVPIPLSGLNKIQLNFKRSQVFARVVSDQWLWIDFLERRLA